MFRETKNKTGSYLPFHFCSTVCATFLCLVFRSTIEYIYIGPQNLFRFCCVFFPSNISKMRRHVSEVTLAARSQSGKFLNLPLPSFDDYKFWGSMVEMGRAHLACPLSSFNSRRKVRPLFGRGASSRDGLALSVEGKGLPTPPPFVHDFPQWPRKSTRWGATTPSTISSATSRPSRSPSSLSGGATRLLHHGNTQSHRQNQSPFSNLKQWFWGHTIFAPSKFLPPLPGSESRVRVRVPLFKAMIIFGGYLQSPQKRAGLA